MVYGNPQRRDKARQKPDAPVDPDLIYVGQRNYGLGFRVQGSGSADTCLKVQGFL